MGAREIAERLDVAVSTVHKWRARRVMPEPDWKLAMGDVWLWQTIEQWAFETGRLRTRRNRD